MPLRRLLSPSNRLVRYLVGLLLVGLFCIQCIHTPNNTSSSVVIAKTPLADAESSGQKLVDLAKTDQIALLKKCLAHYNTSYHDFTCTLSKQERINGTLGAEQQINAKYKESPFSVALHWTKNAPIGDCVLYVEGKYNGNMIVRPANKFLQMLTGGSVVRKPDGAEAMRNTLRPVNMFGFRRGMEELLKVYIAARDAKQLKESFGGFAKVEGRDTIVLERFLPPSDNYPAWKTVIYIDPEYLVPVCIEGYDWNKHLTSRYVYKDVKFNTGLTDDDFLPEANGVKAPKAK